MRSRGLQSTTEPNDATSTRPRRRLAVLISALFLLGAIFWLWKSHTLASLMDHFGALSARTAGFVLAALVANSCMAAWRLKVASGQAGHQVRFSEALGALAVGSIGSALFFQLAGQLAARGAFLGRVRVPFESVVVITLYERAVAALLSLVLALGGAYFIFGHLAVDSGSGGGDLIKLLLGLIGAFAAGAGLVYGRTAVRKIAPRLRALPKALAKMLVLSILVQIPMVAAYVFAVRGFVGDVPFAPLISASLLVMFAASIPISFAGWGVREFSAIAAMGAIGVKMNAAFAAAVLVGAGSLLSTVVLAAIVVPTVLRRSPGALAPTHSASAKIGVNYGAMLGSALPVAAATLVFFQLYVPGFSGTLLNVNLADPVALLCGALFCVDRARQSFAAHGLQPAVLGVSKWRFPNVGIAVAAGTLALGVSLLHGASVFGFTQWALVNRFFGWFVLLSYLICGATVVRASGAKGLRVLLATFGAAAAALALLEVGLLCLKTVWDLPLPLNGGGLEAFSQNRNFFAFQILMALPAVLVAFEERRLRLALLSILLVALFFTGSRSGWISAGVVMCAAVVLKLPRGKDLIYAGLIATAGVLALQGGSVALEAVGFRAGAGNLASFVPNPIPTSSDASERMITIRGGIELFLQHPVFGAGLGAFRHKLILAASGIPLVIHSTYLWLLAELGILGFLVFVAPAAFVLSSEIRRPVRDEASVVLILCLVGFAAMSIPADMMYQRTFWLVCGAALAFPLRPATPT